MAKETKTPARQGSGTAATPPSDAKTPVNTGIDITKLTPEQLAALQKQIKEKKKAASGDSTERFKIIDSMLATKVTTENQKDGEVLGEFKYTTRDIFNKLDENNLVDKTVPKYDQNEIKKIQARKQALEKKRNEKGELVHPEDSFGYRKSEGFGFAVTPVKLVEFFKDAAKVKTLTAADRAVVLNALK
jgi:hypothetical protein